MKVLIACECSGIVREAFARRGHQAYSCDLQPTEIPGDHLQCDVREVLYAYPWDLLICHPECRFMTLSGVQWLFQYKGGPVDEERWAKMEAATDFFNIFADHSCKKKVIENSVMHGYAKERIRHPYTQTIQPWQFGHKETKRTCLWVYGLPPLVPTKIMSPPYEERVHKEGPGPNRRRNRSRTYTGIAEAMAAQWG